MRCKYCIRDRKYFFQTINNRSRNFMFVLKDLLKI